MQWRRWYLQPDSKIAKQPHLAKTYSPSDQIKFITNTLGKVQFMPDSLFWANIYSEDNFSFLQHKEGWRVPSCVTKFGEIS